MTVSAEAVPATVTWLVDRAAPSVGSVMAGGGGGMKSGWTITPHMPLHAPAAFRNEWMVHRYRTVPPTYVAEKVPVDRGPESKVSPWCAVTVWVKESGAHVHTIGSPGSAVSGDGSNKKSRTVTLRVVCALPGAATMPTTRSIPVRARSGRLAVIGLPVVVGASGFRRPPAGILRVRVESALFALLTGSTGSL